MIVINKVKSREEGNDLILSSLLEIDETKFDLLVLNDCIRRALGMLFCIIIHLQLIC